MHQQPIRRGLGLGRLGLPRGWCLTNRQIQFINPPLGRDQTDRNLLERRLPMRSLVLQIDPSLFDCDDHIGCRTIRGGRGSCTGELGNQIFQIRSVIP